MTDRDSLDPRYDPAFQRGYTGEQSAGRPRSVADPAPVVRSAPAPVQPALVPHGGVAAVASPAAPDPGRHSVADAVQAHEVVGHGETALPETAAVPPEPWRNPFLIAVAALGVLCLAAGGIWIGRTREFFDVGAQGSADFWLVMISLVGAPLLLTLGLAIIAGVLFFLARSWQRRPVA